MEGAFAISHVENLKFTIKRGNKTTMAPTSKSEADEERQSTVDQSPPNVMVDGLKTTRQTDERPDDERQSTADQSPQNVIVDGLKTTDQTDERPKKRSKVEGPASSALNDVAVQGSIRPKRLTPRRQKLILSFLQEIADHPGKYGSTVNQWQQELLRRLKEPVNQGGLMRSEPVTQTDVDFWFESVQFVTILKVLEQEKRKSTPSSPPLPHVAEIIINNAVQEEEEVMEEKVVKKEVMEDENISLEEPTVVASIPIKLFRPLRAPSPDIIEGYAEFLQNIGMNEQTSEQTHENDMEKVVVEMEVVEDELPEKDVVDNELLEKEVVEKEVVKNELLLEKEVVEKELLEKEVVKNELLLEKEVVKNALLEIEIVENELLEKDVVKNELLEKDVVKNELLEKDVVKNELLEKDVVKNELQDKDVVENELLEKEVVKEEKVEEEKTKDEKEVMEDEKATLEERPPMSSIPIELFRPLETSPSSDIIVGFVEVLHNTENMPNIQQTQKVMEYEDSCRKVMEYEDSCQKVMEYEDSFQSLQEHFSSDVMETDDHFQNDITPIHVELPPEGGIQEQAIENISINSAPVPAQQPDNVFNPQQAYEEMIFHATEMARLINSAGYLNRRNANILTDLGRVFVLLNPEEN